MSLPEVRIIDSQFAHAKGGMGNGDVLIYPSYFSWYRGCDQISEIAVLTESSFYLVDQQPERVKIGIIIEPRCISPQVYSNERKIWMSSRFDVVYSHNVEFINRQVDISTRCKFLYYPLAGTWIYPDDQQIYPKSKNASIIVSEKRSTEGHKLRHDIVSRFAEKYKVDVYGRGYNKIDSKLEALRDYRYSIVVENERSEGWFTEKVVDCIVCGTIPVYWGDPTIGIRFMNIPQFDSIEALENMLSGLTDQAYTNSLSLIRSNFDRAKEYTSTEDWLWNNGLGDI